uniref:Immunoglobulin V-set domain-containing protein n=1 Tax=Astyanax mexicanus TaxID=7994 RepID=A0A8B9H0W6_ASTMX
MKVLSGSCVDVPCTFTHPSTHRPSEIAWYSYSSTQYPLVYSWRTQEIIEPFRGRTQLSGDVNKGTCSLRITDVKPAMNGYHLYPWIDPDHAKHTFYHKTVKLNVQETSPPVQLTVDGNPEEGGTISITCSVVHTCPSSPPILTFGGISGEIQNNQTDLGSGSWRTQSTISFPARVSDQGREVGCWVQHSGRRSVPSWIDVNVKYIV